MFCGGHHVSAPILPQSYSLSGLQRQLNGPAGVIMVVITIWASSRLNLSSGFPTK